MPRPTEAAPVTDDLSAVPKPARLRSLDVFRGVTIAGMIVVNNQGAGGETFAPLRHAAWDGWTPTDLVFPFFLLIVGVAIPFSLGRRRVDGSGWAGLVFKIVRRSLLIFGIGLALNGFPDYKLATLRSPGVLQRIALCYLLASLVDLAAGIRAKVGLTALLLAGYTLAMATVAPPGGVAGDLSKEGNLGAWVDRTVLGANHLYKPVYDPEGLLSTLPALATTLIGVLAGHWLRSGRDRFEICAGLAVVGSAGVLLGWAWSGAVPINKALWTGPFVLLTAGLGLSGLAACYWLVDLHGYRRWAHPFAVLGMNALAAYVISGMLVRLLRYVTWTGADGKAVRLTGWFVARVLKPAFSPEGVSLAYGLVVLAACYLPVYLMHRKAIYLKA